MCFCPGTLLATQTGEAMVETLRRGDLVATADGQTAPVSWLGRQTIPADLDDPLRTAPICVTAGSLGPDIPSRDLLLSPDHAIWMDGVLVEAGALVNGMTILRQSDVPPAQGYFHVELGEHALLLAGNTAVETFIDNPARLDFDNWDEHEALVPARMSLTEMDCPRAMSHRQVPLFVRRLVATRVERNFASGA